MAEEAQRETLTEQARNSNVITVEGRRAMKELRTIRYEQLNPRFSRSNPEPWQLVCVPMYDRRARILALGRTGTLMIRDAGVPVPRLEVGAEPDWGEAHVVKLLLVYDGQLGGVTMLPDGVGKHFGSFRNDEGAWHVFFFHGTRESLNRRSSRDEPLPTRAEPPGKCRAVAS